MTGMVVAILVFFIFLMHLVIPSSFAPSNFASQLMDIVFIVCAAGLGYLSWATWREQD
jgi:positive regulator of sigma E activity